MTKSKKQKAKLTPYFCFKKIGFSFVSILIFSFSISYKQQKKKFVKLSIVQISRCFIESKITIKKTNKNTLPISNLNQFIVKDHWTKKEQKKESKHCVNSQYFLSETILFQPISFRFLLIYLFILCFFFNNE